MKTKKIKNEELITIAIYKKDWEMLTRDMKKTENFRDKIHELIEKVKEKT